MKTGPDISHIAALVGDPARANMLTALISGCALTATELAQEAGITVQTASSHLGKLTGSKLLVMEKQGRHRYYRLAGTEVASVLEGLMGLAADAGHMRVRTGPKEPAMRRARVCYDHLAGDLAVRLHDTLNAKRLFRITDGNLNLTAKGEIYFLELGIDIDSLKAQRRPMCKNCLDWSVRRHHLAGSLGAAVLNHMYDKKWAHREQDSRIVTFTRRGERQILALIDGKELIN